MMQAQESARWMVLMQAGLVQLPEIVQWADEKIVVEERPHLALIEISTSQEDSFHHVFGHLKLLRANVSSFEALRLAAPAILGAINEGRLRAESAAKFTYSYLCQESFPIPADMQALFAADDEFYLAVALGLGSREAVEREFVAALKNAGEA